MIASLARLVVDTALPPRCPGCGGMVAADHRFCARCWSGLRFLGPPCCAGCQRPFAHDKGEGARCARCLATPPIHDGIFAAVAYGDVPRHVALRLKYGGRTAFADTIAALMARHCPGDVDLLVPVPLHRWRLWSRGYNQAALIASALGRRSGIGHDLDLVRRTRSTPVLRGLDPAARRRAVAAAFALRDAAAIDGRHIAIVDDVHTTGATSDAIARLLRRGGARKVTVLCWARVLQDGDAD